MARMAFAPQMIAPAITPKKRSAYAIKRHTACRDHERQRRVPLVVCGVVKQQRATPTSAG